MSNLLKKIRSQISSNYFIHFNPESSNVKLPDKNTSVKFKKKPSTPSDSLSILAGLYYIIQMMFVGFIIYSSFSFMWSIKYKIIQPGMLFNNALKYPYVNPIFSSESWLKNNLINGFILSLNNKFTIFWLLHLFNVYVIFFLNEKVKINFRLILHEICFLAILSVGFDTYRSLNSSSYMSLNNNFFHLLTIQKDNSIRNNIKQIVFSILLNCNKAIYFVRNSFAILDALFLFKILITVGQLCFSPFSEQPQSNKITRIIAFILVILVLDGIIMNNGTFYIVRNVLFYFLQSVIWKMPSTSWKHVLNQLNGMLSENSILINAGKHNIGNFIKYSIFIIGILLLDAYVRVFSKASRLIQAILALYLSILFLYGNNELINNIMDFNSVSGQVDISKSIRQFIVPLIILCVFENLILFINKLDLFNKYTYLLFSIMLFEILHYKNVSQLNSLQLFKILSSEDLNKYTNNKIKLLIPSDMSFRMADKYTPTVVQELSQNHSNVKVISINIIMILIVLNNTIPYITTIIRLQRRIHTPTRFYSTKNIFALFNLILDIATLVAILRMHDPAFLTVFHPVILFIILLKLLKWLIYVVSQ